ncbi:tetratricopeptide repeat protein [Xanthomonas vesicatoria]|uniref:tetratricopeptide repeat protein n=1 Tax=Xanthomonas vesicatoria TaxID=56460 RepID=UPI001E4CD9F0|nr:tetratricopeptide repeat protein [Xanthomonas vesicatoria]MCC8627473.1 tetratricopeptide repeat protein [Xanthomonas vesicatoria]MDG4484912.1 tetratricopeptide repeat protein [Xanthomonas vesicatoria]
MSELSAEAGAELDRLCARGDKHARAGEYPAALAAYWAAWDLLPDPKEEWVAATWILAAVGDANFLGGGFVAGRDNLAYAMRCPDAIGNPFLHLRLGQCQYELQNFDRAADELMRAYMGAGPEAFENDDPKYLEFLATRAKGIELPRKKPKWKFWQ